MKAVVYEKYGPPEVLRVCEVEVPVPRDEEVLVRVSCVSLNMSDWEILRGKPLYARIFGLFRPRHRSLGSDVTGTVCAVGKSVTHLAVGDEVFGDTMGTFGGFAEFAAVPAKVLMKRPPALSFEDVSTLPQAGIIALQGLRFGGDISPGQEVLINGAGGGSGTFAIQLAKQKGARVTGVDNEVKLAHMRKMGADHVINYREQDYTKTGRKYDRILDLVGKRSVFAQRRCLRPGGLYVMVGGTMSTLLQTLCLGPIVGGISGTKMGVLAANANPEDLETIIDFVESGKLKIVVDRRYSLDEVPEALRYFGEGRARGKVVINV